MGWSYGWSSKESLLNYIHSPRFYVEEIEILETRVVGRCVWHLLRDRREDGRKTIGLVLVDGSHGDWGYKGLHEDMGPAEVNCPLALLKAADAPASMWAAEWRKRVRNWYAAKAARPEYAAGQVRVYGATNYTLVRPAGPRKGWIVTDPHGTVYRMPFNQLSRAQLAP